MAAAWPDASIVFLAFNRREALASSLEHVLEHLDYPPERLEVIVVDNASTDGTAEMVRERFPSVRLIRNPENVGASGWNVGMSTARGEWRLILDDDCHISGDALKVAVRRAEEHGADFVSFRVLSGQVPGYAFTEEYRTGLLDFWGCSAMFSRRVIETEPFYDPALFMWANEMELTMRLLDRGFRHLYLPEVESIHMARPNPPFDERKYRTNYRHWGYIAGKHLRPRDAAGALGNLLLHPLVTAAGRDPRALKALVDGPRGFARGVRARAPVRASVSHVYRRHTRQFASPLPLLRRPLARVGGNRAPERVEAARRSRNEGWYARHDPYYPTGPGTLEL